MFSSCVVAKAGVRLELAVITARVKAWINILDVCLHVEINEARVGPNLKRGDYRDLV